MNHDVNSVGVTRHFNSRVKSIEKKYWEKINIDTINWEKLFPLGKIYCKK